MPQGYPVTKTINFKHTTYLFSVQIHMDGRRENLENNYSRDPPPALYTDMLAGRMEMLGGFEGLLDISLLSLCCRQLK